MSQQIKRMRITVEGKSYDVSVEMLDDRPGRPVSLGTSTPVTVPPPAEPAPPSPTLPTPAKAGAGVVPSPLAGIVVSIEVTAGQVIAAGAPLVTLEAMKMKTIVRAPVGGTVRSIEVKAGAAVEEGAPLVVLG
jgi:biotin carboxyl carrier protein